MVIMPRAMKFNLKAALESLLHWKDPRPDVGDGNLPVSMVLLLREPKFPTLEDLRFAAERAFGTSFHSGEESQYFVKEIVLFNITQAGPHTISFLRFSKPYGDDSGKFGNSLPSANQRQAWTEHKAWFSLDYVKGGKDLELEYAVLADLCAELLDQNCSGVYMPRELSFIPNDSALRNELKRIAASRDLGISAARQVN